MTLDTSCSVYSRTYGGEPAPDGKPARGRRWPRRPGRCASAHFQLSETLDARTRTALALPAGDSLSTPRQRLSLQQQAAHGGGRGGSRPLPPPPATPFVDPWTGSAVARGQEHRHRVLGPYRRTALQTMCRAQPELRWGRRETRDAHSGASSSHRDYSQISATRPALTALGGYTPPHPQYVV